MTDEILNSHLGRLKITNARKEEPIDFLSTNHDLHSHTSCACARSFCVNDIFSPWILLIIFTIYK